MNYVFFLLSFLYSFIFYVFYAFSLKKDIFWKDLPFDKEVVNRSIRESIIFSDDNTIILQSFFGNPLYESILFFILALFLFFYFSSVTLKEAEEVEEKIPKKTQVFEKFKVFFVKLSKKFSYYIGFILFYISLYIISLSFESITFSYFILIINIGIFLFYFLSKQNPISQIFLRINSLIFSLFYIVSYFIIIFGGGNFFSWIDFLNGFLILGIFPVLIYFEKNISKKKLLDNSLLIHFSIYIYGFVFFYIHSFVFRENVLFWTAFLTSIFGVIWFHFLPKIKLLSQNIIILRYIGIIFTYIGIFFGILYQIFDFSYIIFITLLLQALYNIFIHKKYLNIISYFLGIFLSIYLLYFIIFHFEILSIKSIWFLVFSLLLSFLGVIFPYILSLEEKLEIYIFIFFSYLINFVSIILFFIYNHFEILYIGILLLIESLYFFLSYFKLNSKPE